MIWKEALFMAKLVMLYVEGKSDQTFFQGDKFREFVHTLGYRVKIKNLRTKGNVLSNFEKFLKLNQKGISASLLVYDKDCIEFETKRIDEIINNYPNTFCCVAIQEIEAWFIADHYELVKINPSVKLLRDTQSILDPKSWLKKLFLDAGKGYKNEVGFAAHFNNKIDFSIARKNNRSLDSFLKKFENNFNSA